MAILLPSAEVCKPQIAKVVHVESEMREAQPMSTSVKLCPEADSFRDESPSLYGLDPHHYQC